MQNIKTLTDSELRQTVLRLVSRDREALVDLVEHIGEVEDRRLHLVWGFSSLWDYCDRELKLNDGVAYLRITLAKLVLKRPEIKSLLLSGRLCQCSACLLIDFVERAEFDRLVKVACSMSKRAFQDYIASHRSVPVPTRDVIRRVGTKPAKALPPAALPLLLVEESPQTKDISTKEQPVSGTPDKDVKTHRISFLATEEVVDKLKRAQDLEGTDELTKVIGKALDAYLKVKDPRQRVARRQEKKVVKTAKATAVPPPKKTMSRRQPLAIRDAVLLADDERCTFVGPDGIRCNAKRRLQVDHVRPFALGGSSTEPENQRAVCMAHNLLWAKRSFGTSTPWLATSTG